ncbi:hypothetical protein AB0H43_03105 [Hamadaea sp. NPDC050747]|uniref:recombination directionality factor n=1 Tax=Hamadaea sp. NPDC050747 TaxID=3155789 RepID=UPI0033D61D9C
MSSALRIFETDPEAAPKPRFADDLVGRFRSGYQINNRPATLEAWRITTGDPDVAHIVNTRFGGKGAQEWETQGEDKLEVFTTAPKIKVILDGPSAIRQEMVLWGRAGAIRKCDGVEQTLDEAAGQPCACPSTFAERKDAAKKGTGCQPSITVYFRLADDPELGRFKFASGSWSLVKDLVGVMAKLDQYDGPVTAWLKLERVEPKSPTGRSFVKPVIEIVGRYTEAVSARFENDEPPF